MRRFTYYSNDIMNFVERRAHRVEITDRGSLIFYNYDLVVAAESLGTWRSLREVAQEPEPGKRFLEPMTGKQSRTLTRAKSLRSSTRWREESAQQIALRFFLGELLPRVLAIPFGVAVVLLALWLLYLVAIVTNY